jgi:hypothetical protein
MERKNGEDEDEEEGDGKNETGLKHRAADVEDTEMKNGVAEVKENKGTTTTTATTMVCETKTVGAVMKPSFSRALEK